MHKATGRFPDTENKHQGCTAGKEMGTVKAVPMLHLNYYSANGATGPSLNSTGNSEPSPFFLASFLNMAGRCCLSVFSLTLPCSARILERGLG
ncbi:MAG: hypothetical protein L3J82_10835 [Planctomycetes bacterium]|nr:hypothetical protein [Planctomycetota bacterium]